MKDTETKVETKDEMVKLSEVEALQVALAAERAGHAQTLLTTRQSELQVLGNKLVEKYTEGGKYKVTGLNAQTGELTRVPFLAAEQGESAEATNHQPD